MIGLTFSGVAVMAVWLTFSAVGALLGKCAAVVLRSSTAKRSEWTALGGAVGCVSGFLAMIEAIANMAGVTS
jgi:hypothetical protein